MGNCGVTKDLVEMGAVHNKVLPPDGTSPRMGYRWFKLETTTL